MSEQEQSGSADRGFWTRLKSGLGKTRTQLAEGVGNLLLGDKEIDDDVLAELETALLLTDVGVDATREIMDDLTVRVKRKELNNHKHYLYWEKGFKKTRKNKLQKFSNLIL